MNEKLEDGETTDGPAGWIAVQRESNSRKQNIAEMLNYLLVPILTTDMCPDLLRAQVWGG